MFLFATETVAEPVPSKTSNLPLVLMEAVHLPEHLIDPVPKLAAAELHLPVLEDFSPAINVLLILKSPATPFPRQSNTCAMPAIDLPLGSFITGAFLVFEL
jgi:hypothetical protein